MAVLCSYHLIVIRGSINKTCTLWYIGTILKVRELSGGESDCFRVGELSPDCQSPIESCFAPNIHYFLLKIRIFATI